MLKLMVRNFKKIICSKWEETMQPNLKKRKCTGKKTITSKEISHDKNMMDESYVVLEMAIGRSRAVVTDWLS